MKFLIKKFNFVLAINFLQFLVIKSLDPDRYWAKMKDMDPESMIPDPQHCYEGISLYKKKFQILGFSYEPTLITAYRKTKIPKAQLYF